MGLQYSTERIKKSEYEKLEEDEKMVSKTFTSSIKKKKTSPKKKKTSPKKKKTSPKKKKTSPKKKRISSPSKKKIKERKKVSSMPGLTLVPEAETKAGVGYWDEKNVRLRKLKQERKNKKMSMTKKNKK